MLKTTTRTLIIIESISRFCHSYPVENKADSEVVNSVARLTESQTCN